MPYVATLVSNSAVTHLNDELLASAVQAVRASETPKILKSGVAADIFFEDVSLEDAEAALRKLTGDKQIDVFVQASKGRRKKLLIADMDSTIIQQECIDELAAELGLKDKIAAITERAMQGEIDFEPALRERVGLLAGLPATAVEKVLKERIDLTPGAKTLVQTMKANGAYCALVSGGFTHFTSSIAKTVGFNENRANTLIEENGKLSGDVAEPILGREAKRQRLEELVAELELDFSDVLAVGDGANDLAMIDRAGLGIAFHAKPAVAKAADMHVDYGDLTALLYIQGYSEDEFAHVG
ncbi:MAG: phosphoserine phosphatase SerB [Rhodobacteraceae bacterium]|nr:phosphoserine phosphatase SerB [Paracoccaceae bacterium]